MRVFWHWPTRRLHNAMATAAAIPIPEPATPVAELALVPAPQPRLSLYALNEDLLALADTAEMVPADQEQEFLDQFARVATASAEKVDATSHFMGFVESQVGYADAEIARLQERKACCLGILDRLTKYLTLIIKSRGQDAKGKWQKLEGKATAFQLKKCPPSVEITNADIVPLEYKAATVTIPMPLWDKLLDSLDLDFAGEIADAVKKAKIDISKTAIKEALSGNTFVDGARLVSDKFRLERK